MRILLRTALVASGLFALVTTALGDESAAAKTTPQSVETVWQKIGDFCGISSWHPGVARCLLSADKRTRTVTLKGGGTLVEHLVKWSDETHSYTYTLVRGSWPVANYVSTLEVQPAESGSGSVIHWNSHYGAKGATDENARKMIEEFYDAGLTGLAGS